MPTHAHGFLVGMGAVLLFMGGHGWAQVVADGCGLGMGTNSKEMLGSTRISTFSGHGICTKFTSPLFSHLLHIMPILEVTVLIGLSFVIFMDLYYIIGLMHV